MGGGRHWWSRTAAGVVSTEQVTTAGPQRQPSIVPRARASLRYAWRTRTPLFPASAPAPVGRMIPTKSPHALPPPTMSIQHLTIDTPRGAVGQPPPTDGPVAGALKRVTGCFMSSCATAGYGRGLSRCPPAPDRQPHLDLHWPLAGWPAPRHVCHRHQGHRWGGRGECCRAGGAGGAAGGAARDGPAPKGGERGRVGGKGRQLRRQSQQHIHQWWGRGRW